MTLAPLSRVSMRNLTMATQQISWSIKLGQKTAETGGHTQEADPKTPKWSPKK